MEHLDFTFPSHADGIIPQKPYILVGVVASGNLEAMMELLPDGDVCLFSIDTAVAGFSASWSAVLSDFMDRQKPAALRVSVNDHGASPALVSLRLDQAYEQLIGED